MASVGWGGEGEGAYEGSRSLLHGFAWLACWSWPMGSGPACASCARAEPWLRVLKWFLEGGRMDGRERRAELRGPAMGSEGRWVGKRWIDVYEDETGQQGKEEG